MEQRRELVGKLRAIMREAVPREAPPKAPRGRIRAENEAWQRFDAERRLQAPGNPKQTHRAGLIREINRIALRYGWTEPITRALDAAGADALSHLDDPAIEQLAGQMRHLVDCAMAGCDPADALPAR